MIESDVLFRNHKRPRMSGKDAPELYARSSSVLRRPQYFIFHYISKVYIREDMRNEDMVRRSGRGGGGAAWRCFPTNFECPAERAKNTKNWKRRVWNLCAGPSWTCPAYNKTISASHTHNKSIKDEYMGRLAVPISIPRRELIAVALRLSSLLC